MQNHRLALPTGYRLQHYELSRVLGKGGFGITYLGIDRHLGRKVAVKELMPDTIVTREGSDVLPQSESLAPNWAWAKDRFLEEACMLAGFQHPNIVNVHQIIEANGTVYMVMDYIEGESYDARLRRIGREPDEPGMRALLEPLLGGLEEVHANGLLHRDIKPDNIILRREVEPILLDFGSARKLLEGTSVMTSIVTHGYSPIEQYQIKGKQGPWTDIYALGAVTVRAITGQKPPVSADRVSEDEFEWLSYRNLTGFSPRFLRAIDWALRVSPKERPNNIAEWRSSFGWHSKPKTFSERNAAPAEAAPGAPRETSAAAPQAAPKKPSGPPPELPGPTETAPPPPAARLHAWIRKRPLAAAMAALGVLFLGVWTVSGPSKPRTDDLPAAAKRPPRPPAAASPVKPVYTNTLGMPFVKLPGSNTLICVWDTRRRDYEAFAKETRRAWTKPPFQQDADHPAVNVSWGDAKAFCDWLSRKEGREYRLPTDAEWSQAAGLPPESGSTPQEKDGQIRDAFPWGSSWPPATNAGNYASSLRVDDYENTSPVGNFGPNLNGLYDMGGNVWQWCEDWYDRHAKSRVLRGGAWNSCVEDITRSSFRYYATPASGYDYVGFRCVIDLRKTGGRTTK